jgi:hypothetical protein
MAGIFLSYSRDSADVAEVLAEDLKELGHAVWFDHELSGGQTWWDEILMRTRACDVFILALTPQSLSSAACNREYDYAAALGKPILPVLLSDAISTNLLPPALAQIQLVDYRSRDRAAGLKLARAIGSLPPAGPLPDPLPTPPEVPRSYLGGLAVQANKPALSYDEQSALLFDLKRALRDTETAADARTLLKQLRKRRDVYAAIAEEIDGAMAGSPAPIAQTLRAEEPPAAPTRAPAPAPPPAPVHLPDTEPRVRPREVSGNLPTAHARWVAAAASAVVGLILGVLGAMSEGPGMWVWGLVLGTAGGIAGAIAGTRRIVLVSATIGAVAGFLLLISLGSFSARERNIAGVVFGAPPGAILGAVGAALYLKHRP